VQAQRSERGSRQDTGGFLTFTRSSGTRSRRQKSNGNGDQCGSGAFRVAALLRLGARAAASARLDGGSGCIGALFKGEPCVGRTLGHGVAEADSAAGAVSVPDTS